VHWSADTQSDRGVLAGTLADSIDLTCADARQPFIAPDRLLDCLRILEGNVDQGYLSCSPIAQSPWTHVASRATTCVRDCDGGAIELDVRFLPNQQVTLVVGSEVKPRRVFVDGRRWRQGDGDDAWHWWAREDGGGAAVVLLRSESGEHRVRVER
jgi:hypothetical protein